LVVSDEAVGRLRVVQVVALAARAAEFVFPVGLFRFNIRYADYPIIPTAAGVRNSPDFILGNLVVLC
jgi:hypothetical protein